MEADIVYTPVAEAPDGQEVAGVVETPVPSGGGEAGAAVPVWVLPAILVLLAVAAAIAAWLMLRKKRRRLTRWSGSCMSRVSAVRSRTAFPSHLRRLRKLTDCLWLSPMEWEGSPMVTASVKRRFPQ